MDLSTRYLGLDLPHPLMPGSSPLADGLDAVRRLEDAGAAAIVLRSLFLEQVAREGQGDFRLDPRGASFAEAASVFPPAWYFAMSPAAYVEHIGRVKGAVAVPVIASFNVAEPGPWLDHVATLQQAGADALELNVYHVVADPDLTAAAVEDRVVEAARAVRRAVTIPFAVKLLPSYTALPNLARRLVDAGASGLVLFNRFLQPDLDPATRTLRAAPQTTGAAELRLRLRWLAMLSGRVPASLAASGGVQDGLDAIKTVMAGADAVQLVSALLARGPEHLRTVLAQMKDFMEQHGQTSLRDIKGCMSLAAAPDPATHERAYYMTGLQAWSQA